MPSAAPPGELQRHALDLRQGGLVRELPCLEAPFRGAAAEVPAADLPDQVAAAPQVVVRKTALAGVLRETAERSAPASARIACEDSAPSSSRRRSAGPCRTAGCSPGHRHAPRAARPASRPGASTVPGTRTRPRTGQARCRGSSTSTPPARSCRRGRAHHGRRAAGGSGGGRAGDGSAGPRGGAGPGPGRRARSGRAVRWPPPTTRVRRPMPGPAPRPHPGRRTAARASGAHHESNPWGGKRRKRDAAGVPEDLPHGHPGGC